MAGPRTCQNSSPTGKYKLAENVPRASTKNNNTSTSIPAIFQTPTPTSALAPILILLSLYINFDLQKATKLALKLFV